MRRRTTESVSSRVSRNDHFRSNVAGHPTAAAVAILCNRERRCAAPGGSSSFDSWLGWLREVVRGQKVSNRNSRSSTTYAGVKLCLARAERGPRPRPERTGDRVPVPDPDPGRPGGPRRPGRARQGPDRVRQDTGLRDPDRGAHTAGRRSPVRSRPRSDPRAGRPGDRGPRRPRPGARTFRRLRVRRRADSGSGREGQEGARARGHTGPAPGPDGPPPRQPRRRLDPRSRRGRPDARHGLQAAGRPDPAQGLPRPPDDVLLGHARRRRRRARTGATRASRSASRRSCRARTSRARSTTSSSR